MKLFSPFFRPVSLALCWLTLGSVIASERPNIIFILTDDHRADLLGCMGNKHIKTPHIDKLAADGVLFEKAYVTSAICTPSRTSFLLGQYERRHGVNFNSEKNVSVAEWEMSFPVLLRKSGYFTAYIGKNHTPIGEEGYKSGVMESSFDYFYAGHKHLGFYPKQRHKVFKNAKKNTQIEIIAEGAENVLTPKEDFYRRTVKTLQKRPQGKPFFMALCFNVPHNYSTSSMRLKDSDDEIYRTLYRDQLASLPLPETYEAGAKSAAKRLAPELFPHHRRQPGYEYVATPNKLRERSIRHMQTVTGVDRMVGQLREELKRAGVAENTVILFSSDHGLMSGEFGIGGKSLCYEPCMHVPMIVFDPRTDQIKGGQRRQELVLSVDVAPTILSWAGVAVPSSMQGKDMTPLMRQQKVEWREAAFGENLWCTEFGNPRCETVRTKRFRYIRYFNNEIAAIDNPPHHSSMKSYYDRWLDASINGEQPVYEELFDLENDPYEKSNLATDQNYQMDLKRHRELCQQAVKDAR